MQMLPLIRVRSAGREAKGTRRLCYLPAPTKLQERTQGCARVAFRPRIAASLLLVVCLVVNAVPHRTLADAPAGFPGVETKQADVVGADVVWRSERVCGANSLYILLRAHGITPDYRTLSDELVKPNAFTSLAALQSAAERWGLRCRTVKTDVAGLQQLRKPALLHFDLLGGGGESSGHFVTALQTDDEQLVYVDGTTASVERMSWRNVKRLWSGYALHADLRPRRPSYTLIAGCVFIGAGLCYYADKLIACWRARRGRARDE